MEPVYRPVPPQKWPRGPTNALHGSAGSGCVPRTAALLAGKDPSGAHGGQCCGAQHTLRDSDLSINIDEGDETGTTPLIFAAQGGYTRVVKMLLQKGANVEVQADNGFTALHAAAMFGHPNVAQALLDAGADKDVRNEEGFTPLSTAAEKEEPALLGLFISAGADVNKRTFDGATALWMAAARGNVNCVKQLLRAKANPRYDKHEEDVEGRRWTSVTLDVAAQGGHAEVVRELLKLGIKACGGPTRGRDALWTAAQDDHVEVMALLRDVGVVDKRKALVQSAGFGREAAVRFLLREKMRANTDTRAYARSLDQNGRTVLYRAAWGAFPKIARFLLDAGADEKARSQAQLSLGLPLFFEDTPMALVTRSLEKKTYRFGRATEEQLVRLEAIRRLLLQVDAIRAVSWLWTADAPCVSPASRDEAGEVSTPRVVLRLSKEKTGSRRVLDRRVVLAGLFRYSRKK
ncbi:unnamed protein product [Scytosiphon promiscuus]